MVTHVRSSQSSSPFLCGVGAEEESWGRRVQLGCEPRAIKLNCWLCHLPPGSESKGLNCCQATAANETERGSVTFSAASAEMEGSKVRDDGLHQQGRQNLTTYSQRKPSIPIYYLSGCSNALSVYYSAGDRTDVNKSVIYLWYFLLLFHGELVALPISKAAQHLPLGKAVFNCF